MECGQPANSFCVKKPGSDAQRTVGLANGQVGAVGDRGGGGGGGGVGYIVFSANSTTNNASAISPSQTTIP
jgi:hypothetical protein